MLKKFKFHSGKRFGKEWKRYEHAPTHGFQALYRSLVAEKSIFMLKRVKRLLACFKIIEGFPIKLKGIINFIVDLKNNMKILDINKFSKIPKTMTSWCQSKLLRMSLWVNCRTDLSCVFPSERRVCIRGRGCEGHTGGADPPAGRHSHHLPWSARGRPESGRDWRRWWKRYRPSPPLSPWWSPIMHLTSSSLSSTPPLTPCHRHAGLLLPATHLPVLLAGLQAQRLAEGAHQVPARDQRGQLQLLALQLHLHLPLTAGEAHEPPQGRQGSGKVPRGFSCWV